MKKIITSLLLSLIATFCYANEMNLPVRGASMDSVLAQSGEPEKKLGVVGEPPITRWFYSGYTVYFEHQTVIHSVENK